MFVARRSSARRAAHVGLLANWWHQAWARCTVQGTTNYYWGNRASGYGVSVVFCPGSTTAMTSYGTIQGSGNP